MYSSAVFLKLVCPWCKIQGQKSVTCVQSKVESQRMCYCQTCFFVTVVFSSAAMLSTITRFHCVVFGLWHHPHPPHPHPSRCLLALSEHTNERKSSQWHTHYHALAGARAHMQYAGLLEMVAEAFRTICGIPPTRIVGASRWNKGR